VVDSYYPDHVIAGPYLRSFGELVRRTGVPERVIKRWLDHGIVEPTKDTLHKGTGNHRLFMREEFVICSLLAPLHDSTMSLGRIIWFAAAFRSALGQGGPGDDDGSADPLWRLGRAISRALYDEGVNLAVLTVDETDRTMIEVLSDAGTADRLFDIQKVVFDHLRGSPAVILVDLNGRLRRLFS
jgi:hypothetical protein